MTAYVAFENAVAFSAEAISIDGSSNTPPSESSSSLTFSSIPLSSRTRSVSFITSIVPDIGIRIMNASTSPTTTLTTAASILSELVRFLSASVGATARDTSLYATNIIMPVIIQSNINTNGAIKAENTGEIFLKSPEYCATEAASAVSES